MNCCFFVVGHTCRVTGQSMHPVVRLMFASLLHVVTVAYSPAAFCDYKPALNRLTYIQISSFQAHYIQVKLKFIVSRV